MIVEIINTGSELMIGQVLNRHLGYLTQKLETLGIRVSRQHTVPDGDAIATVLAECVERAQIILVTGGLGPTSDDITREILAQQFGLELEFHADILEKIRSYFDSRNLKLPDIAHRQAMVPRGAMALNNDFGTAPGLYLEQKGVHIFVLPGPPRELHPMFEQEVFPRIQSMVSEARPLHRQVIHLLDIGESMLQEAVEDRLRQLYPSLEIGYCARPGEVDLRLISHHLDDVKQATELVSEQFSEHIVSYNEESLEQLVIRLATEQNKTLAVAESCTGGYIAHRLTNVSGASTVLMRGWVTYSNESKIEELGVSAHTLEQHGAVSEAVAVEMACGARQRAGTDIAISTTGIAGPTGGTEQKPVGLVYLGIDDGTRCFAVKRMLRPPRETFKHMASQRALDLVRRHLQHKGTHRTESE